MVFLAFLFAAACATSYDEEDGARDGHGVRDGHDAADEGADAGDVFDVHDVRDLAGEPDVDVTDVDADAAAACPGSGPAYVHGDLWAFWYNFRVACSAQHKWVWICEQRLGEGNCPIEEQRFNDCWRAQGGFPPSTEAGFTSSPSVPNWGVCQPHHWPEKNDADRRPANPVPCDPTTYDYELLRTADPFYGLDWWDGGITAMRHLTIKVFEAGFDPYTNEGQSDGIINLSTHPGDASAFMNGLANHSYSGHVTPGGCLPALTGDTEEPYPDQNFGAFFWLEVPTDRPVTIGATWIGTIAGDISLTCLNMDVWGFPGSFSYHSVDGKPWFTSSPCWDIWTSVRFEAGRYYVWDIDGLRLLPDCSGPPEDLLAVVPEHERDSMRDGACSSM